MFKLLTALAIPISAWLVAGCSGEPTCDYSSEHYMSAQSVPSLKAPEGLTMPDHSAALVIPDPAADAKPIPTGKGRCLDRPPSYFAKTSEKATSDKTPDTKDTKKDEKKDK